MSVPLQKLRIVANDRLRPLAFSSAAAPSPHLSVPRAAPQIRHIRLAPSPHRRDFSWTAVAAVFMLAAMIFLFGAVAGTVFWFTYDATNPVNPAGSPLENSSVVARLAQPRPVTPLPALPVIVSQARSAAQAVPPADIVLPAGDSALAASTGAAQSVMRENGSTTIDDILDSARTRLGQGENIAALVLYERVLAEKSGNHDALEGKAYVLGRLAAMPGASPAPFAELQRMETAMPDNAALQTALGKILAQRGKNTEAIDHLERAMRLSPGDMTTRLDLAILYDRVGRTPEALAIYQKILWLTGDSDQQILPPETRESVRRRAAYLAAARIQP